MGTITYIVIAKPGAIAFRIAYENTLPLVETPRNEAMDQYRGRPCVHGTEGGTVQSGCGGIVSREKRAHKPKCLFKSRFGLSRRFVNSSSALSFSWWGVLRVGGGRLRSPSEGHGPNSLSVFCQ